MSQSTQVPRVVIVGGGFGGLAAAKGLAGAHCSITVIDRRNHHLFQPMLYQVATAALSPAQIASPIRSVLSRQKNCEVILGEAISVDPARRTVQLRDGDVPYDYLVLAAGAAHSYFGNDAWAQFAPGLKTVEDALDIRRRFLLAFERAERAPDDATRAADLTFIVVGAGPTGVETAGAMKEIALNTIPDDFRHADTRRARVLLIEAQNCVLPGGFSQKASERALRSLRAMGVDVRLSTRVTRIDAAGVTIDTGAGTEFIPAHNVIWAAGVKAAPVGATLGAPIDRAGRVVVQPDLSIPDHSDVFVIGDLAAATCAVTGKPVPGVCPAADQMGKYVAGVIGARITQRALPGPFKYNDKGMLATIGRAKAVAEIGGRTFGGLLAWLLWAGVHVFFLIGFRNRVMVMLEWIWAYVFFVRGARLITGSVDTPANATPVAVDGQGSPV